MRVEIVRESVGWPNVLPRVISTGPLHKQGFGDKFEGGGSISASLQKSLRRMDYVSATKDSEAFKDESNGIEETMVQTQKMGQGNHHGPLSCCQCHLGGGQAWEGLLITLRWDSPPAVQSPFP